MQCRKKVEVGNIFGSSQTREKILSISLLSIGCGFLIDTLVIWTIFYPVACLLRVFYQELLLNLSNAFSVSMLIILEMAMATL